MLNESVTYTIRNISDVIFSPYYTYDINYSLEKMNKTYKAFFSVYKLTKGTIDQIMKAINQYDTKSKTDSVVNIRELERFHQKRRKVIIATNDKYFINNNAATLYALLYRWQLNSSINSMTTYTALIPLPPKEDFIVFITFDEHNIYNIQTVASPNQYDLFAPIYLVDLNVDIRS